jgi:hypothetical protein
MAYHVRRLCKWFSSVLLLHLLTFHFFSKPFPQSIGSMGLKTKVNIHISSITTFVPCIFLSEFLTWKEKIEIDTASIYVKIRKDAKCNSSIRRTYGCHRSGSYHPKGRGLKHIKVQGSCKIGTRCPAAMYVQILPSGKQTEWSNNMTMTVFRHIFSLLSIAITNRNL